MTVPPPAPASPPAQLTLEVVACAPSAWDLGPSVASGAGHTPGNVIVGRETLRGELYCCGGFLPCGHCERCEAGLHLACTTPLRPGWNSPGGAAGTVTLPAQFLAPCAGQTDDWASAVALLALAGHTYQAQALHGMTPGDTVLVAGVLGPGALPLQVLSSAGLHPIWLSTRSAELPEGVKQLTALSEVAALPATRRHLICFPEADPALDWVRLVSSCISCTFVGPAPPVSQQVAALLDGQVRLQWIKDIHPHLVLDMMAISKRITVKPWLETHDLPNFSPAFQALLHEETPRWPVLIP